MTLNDVRVALDIHDDDVADAYIDEAQTQHDASVAEDGDWVDALEVFEAATLGWFI